VTEFVVSSRLAAEAGVVWRHAVSPSGVNRELRPLLRMTFPPDVGDLTAEWQPGRRLFRSWLLAGGILPIEYDDLAFEEIEVGRRFLERSALFTQRVWEHERTIEPVPGGCRVTDRIRFVPRLRWLAGLHGPVFRAVFRWRHRKLRALFGEAVAA
jgi:ligand-binding SRPBCC domain-containing protein